MKHLLLCAGFILYFTASYSQSKTSLEDYNYITIGLLKDKKEGRQFKAGYKLGTLLAEERITRGGIWRSVSVYHFINSVSKPVAFVLECKDALGNIRYLCFPAANSDNQVWEKCQTDFIEVGSEWVELFAWAFGKMNAKRI